MAELDPAIYQPARLRIVMVLSGVQTPDLTFLQKMSLGQKPLGSRRSRYSCSLGRS